MTEKRDRHTTEEAIRKREYPESMTEHLGIVFLPDEGDMVRAEMPVDHRTSQPFGMLNGGASLALAETLAGYGSLRRCREGEHACGMQVSGNHLSPVPVGGKVIARGKLVHEGKSTHVWDVEISRPKGSPFPSCGWSIL
ncbi:MAG: hotdog fold thioesterase [Prevotellaceae bacterium]|nr:hotdog fold thioesterase [Prevotellaceae bacterium]